MGIFSKIFSKFFDCSVHNTEKKSRESVGFDQERYGLQMNCNEIDLEKSFNDEVINSLESIMIMSGYFKTESVPVIIKILRNNSSPFGRVKTESVFQGSCFLTVEEKKSLGLNTKMKYSKEFIEYFNLECLGNIEPKTTLECMHLDAFHKVSRKKQIAKFKRMDFVKKVKLHPDHECPRAKRLKKIYDIDDVPELPLSGCGAPFCRCYFEAIIPK